MSRWCRARDLKNPDEFLMPVPAIRLAVADIVQGGLRIVAQLGPDAVGRQGVEPGAFVHFIKMRQRAALVEDAAVAARGDGRPVGVVQQTLSEVRGGREVLQSLLILNADGVAAEIVGNAEGGNV